MATALDLLMSTKEDVNLLSEESDICTIDAKTRAIFVPSTIVVGGVQSDKNAERIKFSCPKIVGDNLDLSKFSVRINFENVSSVDSNVSIKDQYICDDVAVDGENVTFSWLIGRNAARYMGTVRFIVCAVKTDSDSNISVEWNTAIAEVPVLEGIEIDQPQIGQEEKDVINQLLELTKNTSAEAVQNVNSAKEQAIKDIQSVSQPDTTLTIEGGLAEAKATGEAIGSLKEDLSTKISKFYASSQGENHLADSDDGKIMDMMLYGKSEQKQYSGKNLLNATLQTTTVNGVTCTNNGDGTYTLNGTATADAFFYTGFFIFEKDTKYKIVGCPQGGSLNTTYRLDGSLNANSDTGNGIVYSGDGNKISTRIIVFNGATVNNLLFKPMITTDLTATYDDFEPYTGGIPSPNPDYPQEIKSVVNPTVKVCGKNLFGGKAFADKIVELGGTLNEANGKVSIAASVISNKTVFEFPDESKSYTIILSGKNTNTNKQATNLRKNKGICNDFVDRCSITTVTGAKKIFGSYDTQVAIYDYEKCGIFEGTLTYDDFEPYHEQTVALPYTLNAIPVSSGGNVTIDGQQYIADYIDVGNGKIVKYVKKLFLKPFQWSKAINKGVLRFYASTIDAVGIDGNKVIKNVFSISSHFTFVTGTPDRIGTFIANADGTNANIGFAFSTDTTTSSDDFNNWILNNKPFVLLPVLKEELPLTSEQTQALKALTTYYPTTNISVNSEQLDGYTVFNYPISMQNGWNYVKQQLNDNRDYIYDMDTQSAEAYVNSEYAVALTELEV